MLANNGQMVNARHVVLCPLPGPAIPVASRSQRVHPSGSRLEVMGDEASRPGASTHRRERVAAQRAAERRREQRNRLLIAAGAILAVIVIVVVIVVKAGGGSGGNEAGGASNGPTGAALASVVRDVTTVPAPALAKVGAGGSSLGGAIKPVSGGAPLTANGKPEVLLRRRRVLPVLRGRPVGHDRGAEPVRHVQRAEDGPLLRDRTPGQHPDAHVLRLDLREPVPRLHAGGGDHQRPGREGRLHQAADAHCRPSSP